MAIIGTQGINRGKSEVHDLGIRTFTAVGAPIDVADSDGEGAISFVYDNRGVDSVDAGSPMQGATVATSRCGSSDACFPRQRGSNPPGRRAPPPRVDMTPLRTAMSEEVDE